jgi:hypothetical protein
MEKSDKTNEWDDVICVNKELILKVVYTLYKGKRKERNKSGLCSTKECEKFHYSYSSNPI